MRNTDETYKLVESWEERCRKRPHQWDQKSLEQVLDGNFYNLPEEYCKIYNIRYPVNKPIIVHYQASRTVRRNSYRIPGRGKIPKRIGNIPQVLSKVVRGKIEKNLEK